MSHSRLSNAVNPTAAPNECVVAVYDELSEARSALTTLEAANIPREKISMVTRNHPEDVEREQAIQYGDKGEENIAKAASVGGLVGALLGTPLLTLPGVGPLLLAGPIATGAVVGGFLGGMSGWGVHKDRVHQYENKVRAGHTLVVVHGDPEVVAEAQRLLTETGAEVHLHASTSADSKEIDDRP